MTDKPTRPLWLRFLCGFPWVMFAGCIGAAVGHHEGQRVGFREGAEAMKVAIFGVMDRVTAEGDKK